MPRKESDLANHGRANKLYTRALRIWGSKDWPNVPQIRRLQFNAASFFMSCGKAALAEKTARQAVEAARKWLSADDPDLVEPLFMLGMVLRQQGHLPESEEALRGALRLIDHGPGDEHGCLPGVLRAYAELLRKMGKRSGKARRMAARADGLGKHRNSRQSDTDRSKPG